MDDRVAGSVSGGCLAGVLMALCMLSGCEQPAANDGFAELRQLVCDGDYQAAVSALQNYRGRHASRAGLFLGKAHLGLGDRAAAREAFSAVVRDFPQSLEAHKCRYKLAWLTFLDGDREKARKEFQQLSKDPDGPLAAEAAAFVEFLK